MLFSTPTRKKTFDLITSKIFDHHTNKLFLLEHKDNIEYFAVFIDSNLTWIYHIKLVNEKISKTIGLIAPLRYILPQNTIYIYLFSLLFLSYDIVALGNAAKMYTNKTFVLQNVSFD